MLPAPQCCLACGVPAIQSLQEIGFQVFVKCRCLRSITLPEGLITIGPEAFAGCTALVTARIPASVQEIGRGAFAGCPALEALTEEQVHQINGQALSAFGLDHLGLEG